MVENDTEKQRYPKYRYLVSHISNEQYIVRMLHRFRVIEAVQLCTIFELLCLAYTELDINLVNLKIFDENCVFSCKLRHMI